MSDLDEIMMLEGMLATRDEEIDRLRAELAESEEARLATARVASHYCTQLAQAKDELQAERKWTPIETAPRDGTRVLLCTPSGKVADGFFGNYGVWVWPYVMVEPTHWMPMPDLPRSDILAAVEGDRDE